MSKYYIKIIVEGSEEKTFFDMVKEIGTSDNFVLDIEDAGGYGNIADCFLSTLREGELYDSVICAYDVDNRIKDSDSPFNQTREQLNSLFGDYNVTNAVSFCSNPNILQYFLLAADKLSELALTSTSKLKNTKLVNKYWPQIGTNKIDSLGRKIKPDYDAQQWQLDIIKFSLINGDYSYANLLDNAKEMPTDYLNNIPGGNLLPLLIALKDGDIEFFEHIKSLINSIE